MPRRNIPSESPKRFHLVTVADGIYAAISIPGKGAWGNAGIIDLGDRTVIFDTFLTPQAAQELRIVSEQLTGKPATSIINSHWHTDHILGNQAFLPEATIIATDSTRAWMAWDAKNLEQIPAELQELEHTLALEQNEQIQRSLSLMIADLHELVSVLPEVHTIFPHQTFTDTLILHGSQRIAKILTLGGGHTESDAFLYLPESQLVFTGDLLTIGTHPSMWRGDPIKWLDILAQIQALDIQIVVPGHGPVGTKDDLEAMRHYLTLTLEWANSIVRQEKSLEQAQMFFLSAPFDTWYAATNIAPNLEFLVKYMNRTLMA